MTEQEKIKDRIRKLLALGASDSGTSEEEQASAMRKASAMMAKHNIERESLGTMDEIKARFGTHQNKRMLPWQVFCAQAAGVLYGCSLIVTAKGIKGFTYVGRPDNIEASEQTLPWLMGQINRLYDNYVPTDLKGNDRQAWVEKFRLGCAARVLHRANELVASLFVPDKNAGQALIPVGYFEKLKEENKSLMTNIKSAKIGGFGKTNMSAAFAGHRAGDQVKLRKEVK